MVLESPERTEVPIRRLTPESPEMTEVLIRKLTVVVLIVMICVIPGNSLVLSTVDTTVLVEPGTREMVLGFKNGVEIPREVSWVQPHDSWGKSDSQIMVTGMDDGGDWGGLIGGSMGRVVLSAAG